MSKICSCGRGLLTNWFCRERTFWLCTTPLCFSGVLAVGIGSLEILLALSNIAVESFRKWGRYIWVSPVGTGPTEAIDRLEAFWQFAGGSCERGVDSQCLTELVQWGETPVDENIWRPVKPVSLVTVRQLCQGVHAQLNLFLLDSTEYEESSFNHQALIWRLCRYCEIVLRSLLTESLQRLRVHLPK
jgi:hypothetical protein